MNTLKDIRNTRLTLCRGLPLDTYLPPGRHKVNIKVGNVSYNPAYVWVVADEEDLNVTHVDKLGLQPHLMMDV